MLQPLLDTYAIELVTHLVTGAAFENAPEPDLLQDYARNDCGMVAPHYDLQFPIDATPPSLELQEKANCILAASESAHFIQLAVSVGEAMWHGDSGRLDALGRQHGRRQTRGHPCF